MPANKCEQMIELENCHFATHNEKHLFRLRSLVDAKDERKDEWRTICRSPEYHLTNYILVTTGKAQLYSVGSGYCHLDPVNPATGNSGHQTSPAP